MSHILSICSCPRHRTGLSRFVRRTHKKNYYCNFRSSSCKENGIFLLPPENVVCDKFSSPSTICWSTSCLPPQEVGLSRSLDFPLFIHCFSSSNFFPLNFHFFSPSPSSLRPFTPLWEYPHFLISIGSPHSVRFSAIAFEGLCRHSC